MRQLVSDWKGEFLAGNDTRIFAGTRLETRNVNRMCQRLLLDGGKLSAESVSIGRDKLHVGDCVVITRNNAALMVRNGTMGQVVGVDAATNEVRVKIDNGLSVRINVEAFPHIDLGYCTTTHKGQGQTVESAFVLVGGPMTDRELSYVQGSRAKGDDAVLHRQSQRWHQYPRDRRADVAVSCEGSDPRISDRGRMIWKAGLLITAALICYELRQSKQRRRRRKYKRGRELNRKPTKAKNKDGLRWGDSVIPESAATQHFLAVGTTGSGKSIVRGC